LRPGRAEFGMEGVRRMAAIGDPTPGVPQAGELPHFCCTPAGRMGPYGNAVIRAGQMCSAVLPNGVAMVGQACY